MSDRAYSWPDGHWDWYQHLAFKHGVRAGRLIFVGGQVDKDSRGEPLRAGDLEAQTAVVVRHIETVLRGFGASMADVTKLVALYATDGSVDETEFVADVGRQVLANGGGVSGPGPVITPIPLPCLALPGMRVEIEAVAMLGPDGEPLSRTAANPIGLPPLPGRRQSRRLLVPRRRYRHHLGARSTGPDGALFRGTPGNHRATEPTPASRGNQPIGGVGDARRGRGSPRTNREHGPT